MLLAARALSKQKVLSSHAQFPALESHVSNFVGRAEFVVHSVQEEAAMVSK